jgi:hypothetical protein
LEGIETEFKKLPNFYKPKDIRFQEFLEKEVKVVILVAEGEKPNPCY